MSGSRTESRVEELRRRSGLVVYLAVWTAGFGFALDGSWLLGSLTALIYVGLHQREFRRRGRTFMEADSTALPVSFLSFSALTVGFALAGRPPLEGKDIALCWAMYLVVFVLGHAAALSVAAVVGAGARLLLRARIREEKEGASPPESGPEGA